MRIVVFWDSISEWSWDYEKGGWVNRLKIDLWKKYWYNKMLMNYWVSAYTSNNIIKVFQPFFDGCSRREPWKEKESTVVIAIWINDCCIDTITNEPRVNKEQFRKNIKEIINICKSDNLIKKVVFIGNTNIDEKVVNNDERWDFLFFNSEIKKYNEIIKENCNKNNLDFIDLFWLMEDDDLEDWLHPNTKWHEKIFDRVRNFITD